MSNIQYFTIYDKKAEVYQKPMVFPSAADAVRSIQFELKNPDSYLSQWPEDYTLVKLSEFNNETGGFEGDIIQIAEVIHLVPKEKVIPVGTAPIKE